MAPPEKSMNNTCLNVTCCNVYVYMFTWLPIKHLFSDILAQRLKTWYLDLFSDFLLCLFK